MSTRLAGKELSPLTVRKYTNLPGLGGLPVFVALITDDGLNTLDEHVIDFTSKHVVRYGPASNLQWFREYAGQLTEHLAHSYPRAEGVAVIIFPDKAAVASLRGDFMNHLHCRMELYAIINTMWHL